LDLLSQKFGSDNWYDSSIKKCVSCTQNGVKGVRQDNQCIYSNVFTNNSTSTLATTKFQFKTNLKLGVRNEEVKVLQNLLLKLNFLKGTATGYFGPATQTALKKYQKNNKLLQTGVVDDATLKILNI
jgi:peptidoglycan hydrolase-like protein with peptidoglycan-binding domain